MQLGDRLLEEVRQIVEDLFPSQRIVHLTPLVGGLINTNLKIEFTNAPAVVVRIYREGEAVCKKEAALLELLHGFVPVPKLIRAQPEGCGPLGAFAVLEYVEGITFQQLKRTGNVTAINEAAASAGVVLGAIGQIQFDKPGSLLTNELGLLEVGEPYTNTIDPTSEILELFLSDPLLLSRVRPALIDEVRKFAKQWSTEMPAFEDVSQLVHCDFGNRNILVREKNEHWTVVAVLDWEFAMSGSPLLDVGHFLRYERRDYPLREPFFSRAFIQSAGSLPDNWREIVGVVDLTALVECLTHRDLPKNVEAEMIELIQATLEHRDPKNFCLDS